MGKIKGVLIVVAVLVLWFVAEKVKNGSSDDHTQVDNQPSKVIQTKKINIDPNFTPEKQQKRYEVIQELRETGIVYKIEKNGLYPHIYVGDKWYGLNIDDKEWVVDGIVTYYMGIDSGSDKAVLYDSKSGKEIGTYSKYGLEMR